MKLNESGRSQTHRGKKRMKGHEEAQNAAGQMSAIIIPSEVGHG